MRKHTKKGDEILSKKRLWGETEVSRIHSLEPAPIPPRLSVDG